MGHQARRTEDNTTNQALNWGVPLRRRASTRRQSRAAVSNLFHMESPKENRMKGSERTEGRASLLTLRRFLFFHVGKLNTGLRLLFPHYTGWKDSQWQRTNVYVCAQSHDWKYRGHVRTKLGSVNWWNPSMKMTGWWSYTTMILKFCCFISLKKKKHHIFHKFKKAKRHHILVLFENKLPHNR